MAKFTSADWDDVRKRFRNSIMAETSLISLAQNLDMKEWHVKGEEEKPSKYIEFTWDELLMLPEIAGSEAKVDHLVSILKETLAFDDPFGEMVAQVEEAGTKENPILKTLSRLGIPEDYPLDLANFSEGTRIVCGSEGVKTIGEFATLGQQMATRVVLGGDFRHALNALTHGDEEGIGQFLPYRRGSSGLHLAEAVGLVAARLPLPDQVALGKKYGAKLPPQSAIEPRTLTDEEAAKMLAGLKPAAEAVFAWFKDEKGALTKNLAEGASLERYFVVLNDPAREAIALRLTTSVLGVIKSASTATEPEAKKKGFFSRLFGRE
jgi:hypothetical protein